MKPALAIEALLPDDAWRALDHLRHADALLERTFDTLERAARDPESDGFEADTVLVQAHMAIGSGLTILEPHVGFDQPDARALASWAALDTLDLDAHDAPYEALRRGIRDLVDQLRDDPWLAIDAHPLPRLDMVSASDDEAGWYAAPAWSPEAVAAAQAARPPAAMWIVTGLLLAAVVAFGVQLALMATG